MTWWDREIAIIKSPWRHQDERQLEIRDASLGGTFETSIVIAIAEAGSRFDDEGEDDIGNYLQVDFTLPEMLELQAAVGKAIEILKERNEKRNKGIS